jgi:DNA-binding response OmpR family regulator
MVVPMHASPTSVLIIEDDSSVGRTMADLLECSGFLPTLVTSADQAHEAMLETNDFDVVLLDLQLDHERGESLIESVRACGAAIPPIVIYSAMPTVVAQAAFKQLGAAAVLGKNSDVTEIVRALKLAAHG